MCGPSTSRRTNSMSTLEDRYYIFTILLNSFTRADYYVVSTLWTSTNQTRGWRWRVAPRCLLGMFLVLCVRLFLRANRYIGRRLPSIAMPPKTITWATLPNPSGLLSSTPTSPSRTKLRLPYKQKSLTCLGTLLTTSQSLPNPSTPLSTTPTSHSRTKLFIPSKHKILMSLGTFFLTMSYSYMPIVTQFEIYYVMLQMHRERQI
jgi:hypothetical protein